MPTKSDSRLKILDIEKKSMIYHLKPKTWHQRRLGFTLIELLIVIALIAITTGIISTAYISSQQKGRDAQRKSDLQQVKKALEAAKNDCSGATYYPFITGGDGRNKYISIADMLKNNGYLVSAPNDPKFIGWWGVPNYWYEVGAETNNVCELGGADKRGVRTYYLYAHLEITNDPDSAKSLTKCGITLPYGNLTIGDYVVCPD